MKISKYILNKYTGNTISRSGKSTLYLRLRSKFLICIILLTLITFVAFGLVNYYRSKSLMVERTSLLANENSLQIAVSIDYYLKNLNSFAQSLSENKKLKEYIAITKNAFPETEIFNQAKKIEIIKKELVNIPDFIPVKNYNLYGVYAIYKNTLFTLYSRYDTQVFSYSYFSDEYLEKIPKELNKTTLIGTDLRFFDNGNYKYVTTIASTVLEPLTRDTITFVLDFDYKALESVITNKNSEAFPNRKLYITDENNSIMLSVDQGILTTKLSPEIIKNITASKPEVSTVTHDGKNMYMYYSVCPYSFWKIITLLPISEVLEDAVDLRNFSIILISAFALMIFTFSFIALSVFLKPLDDLSTVISGNKNSVSSNMEKYGPPDNLTDKPVNISNIENIVHKVYSTQLEQKEAQLRSLQNQINPHFLYNTLESIRGAAIHHGADNIASMSKSLSMFFRYSIDDSVLVTIGDEIKHLENYIAIQNFRHDDKFTLEYNIPQKLYDSKMLKLTLQPLVENSIKHGLEMKLGKGSIKIEAFNLDNIIKIEISDDGTGISPKKVQELNEMLNKAIAFQDLSDKSTIQSNRGIGIHNVNSRIKLYFGDQYGLRFRESIAGTIVEITIPFIT